MINNKFGRTLLLYVTVFIMIYMSGSIFFIEVYYRYAVIIWIIYSCVALMVYSKMHIRLKKVQLLMIVGVFIALTIVLNQTSEIFSYLALFAMLTGTFFVSEIMTLNEFEAIYIKCITIIAAISLFFFILGVVYPKIILYLPRTSGSASCDYYNAGIYVYNVSKVLNTIEMRNNSIFWEGGSCQAFFILGMIMNVKKISCNKKETWFSLFVLSIAVITTFSFTGYFALGLVLYMICCKLKIFQKILLFSIFFVSITVLLLNSYGRYFLARLSAYTSDFTFILERLGLQDCKEILKNFDLTYFFGITFDNYYQTYGGSNNSILYYAISLGIVFIITILLIYRKYVISFEKKQQLFVGLILILLFFTESLLLKPIFLILGLLESSKSVTLIRRWIYGYKNIDHKLCG